MVAFVQVRDVKLLHRLELTTGNVRRPSAMLWKKVRSPEKASVLGMRKSFEHRESKCKTTLYNGVIRSR